MTERPKFEEIDVERINIVESDGTVRLAFTNAQRFPDPVLAGESFSVDRQGGRGAGFVYYNDDGTEMGGFSFGGGRASNGHNAALLFDGFEKDQCLGLYFGEENGLYGGGLVFQDRANVPIIEAIEDQARVLAMEEGPERDDAMRALQEKHWFAQRFAVGREADGSVGMFLNDTKGRPRLRVSVGADDEPRIQFLDAEGNVTFSLPPEAT